MEPKVDKINSIHRILPILNVGTYWGQLNTDNTIDHYLIEQDYEDGRVNFTPDEYWEGFDNSIYMNRILESAQDIIDELVFPAFEKLGLGITSIKVTKIDSPRYYNFRDDWLEFDIIVEDKEKMISILLHLFDHCDSDEMDEFFQENYGSYDGFHSFMSSTSESVGQGIEEGEDDEIGQFLYYIFKEGCYNGTCPKVQDEFDVEYWNERLYEHFTQDFCYTEFLTEEFLEKYETGSTEVVNFIRDNYMKYEFEEMVNEVGLITERYDVDHQQWDEGGLELTNRIVKRVFDEIESNTMTLELATN